MLNGAGSISVSGPLDDPDDPQDDVLRTYVFATVAQPGQGGDGVIGTATDDWAGGTTVWSIPVPPAQGSFSTELWAWVNAFAVRHYTNGNADTVTWSRWVQVEPAPS